MSKNVLSQRALERLQRYRGRVEGAVAARDAADSTARAYNEQYVEALRAACEGAGIDLPPEGVEAKVNINWETGAVDWETVEQPREPFMGGLHQEVPDGVAT